MGGRGLQPGCHGLVLFFNKATDAAEAVFEEAMCAARAKWGEELLESGMCRRNAIWVGLYALLLQQRAREAAAEFPDDEAQALDPARPAANVYVWVKMLLEELQGKQKDEMDQSLLELRESMRKARGARAAAAAAASWEEGKGMKTTPDAMAGGGGGGSGGGDGAGLSKKARQKLEAQRRAAEERRKKKERKQARAKEEVVASRAATKEAAATAVEAVVFPSAAREGEGGKEEAGAVDAVAAAVAAVSLKEAAPARRPQQEEEAAAGENECPICLMDLDEGHETLGGCGRTFHGVCLNGWRKMCQRKTLQLSCP